MKATDDEIEKEALHNAPRNHGHNDTTGMVNTDQKNEDTNREESEIDKRQTADYLKEKHVSNKDDFTQKSGEVSVGSDNMIKTSRGSDGRGLTLK